MRVRRVALWPVAKVALLFHTLCFAVTLAVGLLLWRVAGDLGLVSRVETLLRDVGFAEDFTIKGPVLFRAAVVAGAAMVFVNTVLTVLLGGFYNAIAAAFGGFSVSVREERPHRKAVVGAAAPMTPSVPVMSVAPFAGSEGAAYGAAWSSTELMGSVDEGLGRAARSA